MNEILRDTDKLIENFDTIDKLKKPNSFEN